MSRKKLVVFLIALVGVMALAAATFFLVTKGRVVEKDGLLQNSRVYMTNVYYENERVHYTVVNKTFQRSFAADKPYVQKKVEGAWVLVSLYEDISQIGVFVEPFSERHASFSVEYQSNLTPGEYSLIFGELRFGANGTWQGYGDHTYTVGYFTVTT